MATYNFTVRATDNLGAYADRTFSITVNNTNIERFVAVGSTGAAHSPDGQNWTLEAGQSGYGVAYGNGQWVIYGVLLAGGATGTALQIRTSTDAYNWTTRASGIPATTPQTVGGTTYNPANYDISCLRYVNGLWSAFVTLKDYASSAFSTYGLVEYTSPDLVTWTLARTVYSYTNNASQTVSSTYYQYAHDYQYDTTTGNYVVTVGSPYGAANLLSRNGTGAWAARLNLSASVTAYSGQIFFCNGLWCYAAPFINGGGVVYTSTDTIGWTQRTIATSATAIVAGLVYSNGRLITRSYGSSSSTGSAYFYSLNGGRTWVSVLAATSVGVGNNGTGIHQPSVSYGGKTLVTAGDGTLTYNLSLNDMTGANAYSLPAIGTFYAFGVRNS